MAKCVVNKCYSNICKFGDPTKKLIFFRIPQVIRNNGDAILKRSERRRAAWLSKIKNYVPSSDDRVCSDHFVSGAPSHLCLEEDIDWVPTLNLGLSDDEEPSDVITEMTCEADPNCQLTPSVDFISPVSASARKPSVETEMMRDTDSNCQLTPSVDFISPVPATARKPSNHIVPLPSTSNAFSTTVAKPNTPLCRSAGSGVSILKLRNHLSQSLIVNSQVSPSLDTKKSNFNSSCGMFSPIQVKRNRTSNVKCYNKRPRQSLVSESDHSSNCGNSNVSTEHKNSVSGSDFDSSVLVASQDPLAGKVCLDRSEYESLKTILDELRQKNRKYRDSITDLEVDKLELQEKLKSAEGTVSHLTSIINNMEEDFKEKEEERLTDVQRNYEELCRKREKEFEKIKREAMDADTLTFRKLEIFSASDDKVKFYTGFPDYSSFKLLLDEVIKKAFEGQASIKCALLPWQNFLMTLMRLRLGLLLRDLAYRFGVSTATAARNFDIWLDALYQVLCPSFICLPEQDTSWDTMPRKYRKYIILKSIKPVKLLMCKEGDDVAQIDKIVRVCRALTNMSPSVVKHPDLNPHTFSESEDDLL